jgi:DNA/RNA-binding domain of Phe-tRNA-synthetase-like protein
MLLSKALRMQQDLEDKKHEVIIEGLENKIKDQALLSKSESFEQEKQKFNTKFEAEVEKSSQLQKSLKELQNKCLEFSNRCVQRLRQVFNSVGASSEKFNPSIEDLPGTFEHI